MPSAPESVMRIRFFRASTLTFAEVAPREIPSNLIQYAVRWRLCSVRKKNSFGYGSPDSSISRRRLQKFSCMAESCEWISPRAVMTSRFPRLRPSAR